MQVRVLGQSVQGSQRRDGVFDHLTVVSLGELSFKDEDEDGDQDEL